MEGRWRQGLEPRGQTKGGRQHQELERPGADAPRSLRKELALPAWTRERSCCFKAPQCVTLRVAAVGSHHASA